MNNSALAHLTSVAAAEIRFLFKVKKKRERWNHISTIPKRVQPTFILFQTQKTKSYIAVNDF